MFGRSPQGSLCGLPDPWGSEPTLQPREGALREELARITAEARTAVEGTLASGKCLLFKRL